MIRLNKLIQEKPLISILSLPFFFLLILDGLSPSVLVLSGFLLIIDNKLNINKLYVYSLFIFIFYCNIIFNDTKFTFHDLRLRYFSLIFLVICILINYLLIKKKIFIKFINVFFIIFSFNILLFNYLSEFEKFDRTNFLKSLDFEYQRPDFFVQKSSEPLIFIVLDEFSSTSEVFRHTNDSIDYQLDLFLKKRKYLVHDKAKTKTLRTSLSLPSIFNFNLHNSYKNDSIELLDKGLQTIDGFFDILVDNLLVDSLNIKSVKSFSYGLLPFKKGINDENFYYYWLNKVPDVSFVNLIIDKTIIGTFLHGTNRETKFIDRFRKQSLDKLKSLTPQKNSFYYFHLFFPHDPYSFYDEYPKRNLNYITLSDDEYLKEHIKYKRWFTNKIISLLKNKPFKNCRVIIAGDHGFRYNKDFNPELTNIYFKGYKEEVTDKIEFVQDLGYLINESF